ncbi:hypothetical protein ACQJBY_064657 [Aegilops geniculata]
MAARLLLLSFDCPAVAGGRRSRLSAVPRMSSGAPLVRPPASSVRAFAVTAARGKLPHRTSVAVWRCWAAHAGWEGGVARGRKARLEPGGTEALLGWGGSGQQGRQKWRRMLGNYSLSRSAPSGSGDGMATAGWRGCAATGEPTLGRGGAGCCLFFSRALCSRNKNETFFHLLVAKEGGGVYTVGDFMTKREQLHVVKPSTSVDEALERLVEHRITGFPVTDDHWNLVGVVSDYDLLALDLISGNGQTEADIFPEVDSTWKTFHQIQKLLSKTNGKVVSDVMTSAPLVVRETTNLEDAARLLLVSKYRRLPVVDSSGKLVGIITRGNVVRAALEFKKNVEGSL